MYKNFICYVKMYFPDFMQEVVTKPIIQIAKFLLPKGKLFWGLCLLCLFWGTNKMVSIKVDRCKWCVQFVVIDTETKLFRLRIEYCKMCLFCHYWSTNETVSKRNEIADDVLILQSSITHCSSEVDNMYIRRHPVCGKRISKILCKR